MAGRTKCCLCSAYIQQVEPDGRLLTIEGEAGIGKTRLAEDFLQNLASQGAVILSARCYEGENNLAYASLIQILRAGLRQPQAAANLSEVSPYALAEAGRLLPELLEGQEAGLPTGSLEAPGAQNRFYEGIGSGIDCPASMERSPAYYGLTMPIGSIQPLWNCCCFSCAVGRAGHISFYYAGAWNPAERPSPLSFDS